ncbi:hypothetical protein BJY01DRAFT_235436 [Aspergillus pseudoustus]|uniref:AMP-dependent synthetase/ligase domain-containing protein n=1 Tax=Aspergillus pseudoustus TaxID=1810923 RepID=A0ABR4JYU3_9EURO
MPIERMDTPRMLWEHPNPQSTEMWRFKQSMAKKSGQELQDYDALHAYSTAHRSDFWLHIFEYFPIVYGGDVPIPCVDEASRIDTIPTWFRGVRLNFAQNILFSGDSLGRPWISPAKADDKIAITEVIEGKAPKQIRHTTWKELRSQVGRASNAMRAHGIQKGDRIAVVASNQLNTLIVFLATTAIGAIFSSSSTDMGVKGILDRLTQIKPTYLFMEDHATYNGRTINLLGKMRQIAIGMRDVAEFKDIICLPRLYGWQGKGGENRPKIVLSWEEFLSASRTDKLVFEDTLFSDPFLVVYSSGTTGQPKCIVHSGGAVVISGWKECVLHRSLGPNSIQLQYTTTGWIMYLISVQALLFGARMVMYDGSPLYPNPADLINLLGQLRVTHFGTSPGYLRTLKENSVVPKLVADLRCLEVLTSTGMLLSEQLFQWFYDEAFPKRVQLDNISGGTDLAGCFFLGNPILPLYLGGCQSISLGMAVKVFNQETEESGMAKGQEIEDGLPGELVCVEAFPNMPIKFMGDGGSQRYFNSYFSRFDNAWTHGDFIMRHPITKQIFLLGRSDGVLNPSGVRFGSGEIYSVIEATFPDRIADSLCVGQRRPQDPDERVILFLLMKPGHVFTSALAREVKESIRQATSARHVPTFVFETKEIPITINSKKVELPVKQIVSGMTIRPSSTLANPQCLGFFYQFAEDKNLVQLEFQKASL